MCWVSRRNPQAKSSWNIYHLTWNVRARLQSPSAAVLGPAPLLCWLVTAAARSPGWWFLLAAPSRQTPPGSPP